MPSSPSGCARRRRPFVLQIALTLLILVTAYGVVPTGDGAERHPTDRRSDHGEDRDHAATGPGSGSALRSARPGPEVGTSVGGVTLTDRRQARVGGEGETVVGFDDPPPAVVVVGDSLHSAAMRYRTDGAWTEWTPVPDLDHEAPDGVEPKSEGWLAPAPAYGPIWLGGRTDAIAIKSSDGEPLEFDVLSLDPSGAPSGGADHHPSNRAADEMAGAVIPAVAGPSVVAPVPRLTAAAVTAPTINQRSRWAAAGWAVDTAGCGRGPSRADNIAAAVIHHTVTGNSYRQDQVDDLLRSIYYTHVVVNGWCDVGYNFVVDRFGGIWEARTGSRNAAVIGGHAKGFNTATVGVALLGQHQSGVSPASASPSTATTKAVQNLLHWRLGQYGVDPAGMTWLRNHASSPPLKLKGESWHYLPTVLGHRDLGLTSCPGNLGYSVVGATPSALVARRDLSLPYRFEQWTERNHGPGLLMADTEGGLRPAGSAPQPTGATAGLVAPSRVVATDGDHAGGYQLTSTGELIPFGQAPSAVPTGNWPRNGADPVDIDIRKGGGGWVIDERGAIAAFGPAPTVASISVSAPVAAMALDDTGSGYVVDTTGRLHPVGSTAGVEVPGLDQALPAGARAVDLAVIGVSADSVAAGPAPNRPRGWVLDSAGTVRGFGGAPTVTVNRSVTPVALAVAAGEPGGWMIDSTGQVWPFAGARLIRPVSTDVTRANVVDATQLGLAATQDFLAGPDARYLTALYRLFNARAASDAEISRGVAQLEDGEGRSVITDRLARSPGWAGISIDAMYRDVLGRNPDQDGRRYWLGQIADGMRYEDLGVYFYGSAEYAERAGGDREYVATLYQVLLGRQGEPDGLDYWTAQLAKPGVGPPTVAHSFYLSIESRRDRVSDLYRKILGRTPSARERDYWAGMLLDIDDVELAAELAASAEYYRKVAEG